MRHFPTLRAGGRVQPQAERRRNCVTYRTEVLRFCGFPHNGRLAPPPAPAPVCVPKVVGSSTELVGALTRRDHEHTGAGEQGAAPVSATVVDAARASTARVRPRTISPACSACERSEWTVARTAPVA